MTRPWGGQGVVATDCDRDGNLDLIELLLGFGTPDGASLGVLRGIGDGTFVPGGRDPIETELWPRGMQAADLNRDQIPDLLVVVQIPDWTTPADEQRSTLIVRLGDGDCGLDYEIRLDLGAGYGSLAVADLDGDQILDLAVSAGERISTFHGNGDGSFSNRQNFAVGGTSLQVVVTDWNADGVPDVVASDQYLHLLLGTGGGHFAPAIDCALKVSSPVVADFDGDGVVDLASGKTVLFGMHECNITRQITLSKDPLSVVLAAGDFNGDGAIDLVFWSDEEWTVFFLPGDGHGSFGAAVTLEGPDPEMRRGPPVPLSGDFNGDGRLDLLTTRSTDIRTLINTCQ